MPFVHEKGSQHLNTVERLSCFTLKHPTRGLLPFSIAESAPVQLLRKQSLFRPCGPLCAILLVRWSVYPLRTIETSVAAFVGDV